MGLQTAAFATVTCLVLAGTLVGLVTTGRARHCLTFVVYLTALVTCETLTIVWPAEFYTAEFWMIKQGLYDVLRTVVALEMAWRVVRAFPGALRIARWSALALLVGALAVLATGPHRARYEILFTWQPRVVACTALLFTLTALLVAWYHLPIRAIHRAIMGGFAIYSAFFVTTLRLLQEWGWDIRWVMNAIQSTALLGVSLWWLRTSWSREEEAMPQVEEIQALVEGYGAKTAVEKAA
jgi:hypothetical protein